MINRVSLPRFSWWVSVNVFFIYLSVGIVLCYAYWLAQAATMYLAGLKGLLFFGNLEIKSLDMEWGKASVSAVYLLPLLLCGLTSVLCYGFYARTKRQAGPMRIYFLWGQAFSLCLLLGSFLQGVFNYKAVSVVLAWFFVPRSANLLLGILALGGLVLLGLLLRPFFLKIAPSASYKAHQHPRRFLLRAVLLPVAAALLPVAVVAWRVKSPEMLIMFACPLLAVLGAVFSARAQSKSNLRLVKDGGLDRFSPLNLGLFVLALAFMLYTAGHGLPVGF